MKDDDLDELVEDGVLTSYKFGDGDIGDLELTFPNGKVLRIEALAYNPYDEEHSVTSVMVNLT